MQVSRAHYQAPIVSREGNHGGIASVLPAQDAQRGEYQYNEDAHTCLLERYPPFDLFRAVRADM